MSNISDDVLLNEVLKKEIARRFIIEKVTKAQLARDYNVPYHFITQFIKQYESEIERDLAASIIRNVIDLIKSNKIVKNVYEDKLKNEIEEEITKIKEPVKKVVSKPIPKIKLTNNQKLVWKSYLKQKDIAKTHEPRQGVIGRARSGVKTIRFITMEILQDRASKGQLTKENREEIIEQIKNEANVTRKTAAQYFSGHKVFFGGYQDDEVE